MSKLLQSILQRFEYHMKGVFFTYRTSDTIFNNEYDENHPWCCKEFWSVFIQLRPRWFDAETFYYDGHTAQSITLFGLTFGKTYFYESARLEPEVRESGQQEPAAENHTSVNGELDEARVGGRPARSDSGSRNDLEEAVNSKY